MLATIHRAVVRSAPGSESRHRVCPFGGSHGAAGEIGHVIVTAGGALCSCGCVEGYAGRRSMAGVASAMVEAGRSTALFDIRGDEGKSKLTSKVWSRASSEGDEMAVELFDVAVDRVGVAVGSAGDHRLRAASVSRRGRAGLAPGGPRVRPTSSGRFLVRSPASRRPPT
jgi:hypothetical protein